MLALPFVTLSQIQPGTISITIKKKGFNKKEWSFLPQMMLAAKELDKGSKNVHIRDSVLLNLSNMTAKQQIKLGETVSSASKAQKTMITLEKRILGNSNFPREEFEDAFAKYPSYSYKAMLGRIRFYIKTMEHMEDDE